MQTKVFVFLALLGAAIATPWYPWHGHGHRGRPHDEGFGDRQCPVAGGGSYPGVRPGYHPGEWQGRYPIVGGIKSWSISGSIAGSKGGGGGTNSSASASSWSKAGLFQGGSSSAATASGPRKDNIWPLKQNY